MMKKIYLFSFALLFLISLTIAGEFGYNYLEDKNAFFGIVEFDGGWENGGCSIIDGEIFCQVVNTINLTSVNITKENITITESITALGNFTVDSPTFHVDSINNLVGIGTISPDFKLQVDGDIVSETTATDSIGSSAIRWLKGWFSGLDIEGDLNQVSGNSTINMVYGEMWNHTDAGFTVDLITQMVYENITNLKVGLNNGFSFSSSKLTTLISGVYKADYSISFSGSANSEIGFDVGISGIEQNQTHAHRKIGTGGDIGNVGGTGIITLNAGDVITLMARDEAAPVQDITIVVANLNLWRIGN